jgi:hypothetical protein
MLSPSSLGGIVAVISSNAVFVALGVGGLKLTYDDAILELT